MAAECLPGLVEWDATGQVMISEGERNDKRFNHIIGILAVSNFYEFDLDPRGDIFQCPNMHSGIIPAKSNQLLEIVTADSAEQASYDLPLFCCQTYWSSYQNIFSKAQVASNKKLHVTLHVLSAISQIF